VDITKLDDKIADILGTTAVIVNDLKQRRQRDYDFDWDKALQVRIILVNICYLHTSGTSPTWKNIQYRLHE
jgi:arginyl-tRNA synthetase